MAEEPIRKEDIIDLQGTQESINELIKTLENLSVVMRKDLKEAADELQKSLQGVNVATKEGQERVRNAAAQSENLAAQQKEQNRLDKEVISLKARLNSLNSNEAQEVQKLKVAIENKNKAMKDAARLDDSAEGSINKMRQRLKELTAEYNRLDKEAREKVAPSINKLSAELKKAESAIGNNTRSVGSYKQSILSAGKQLLGFTGIVGGAVLIVNKLKDAFVGTETGTRIFQKSIDVLKTIGQGIVSGDKIKDIYKNAILASNASEELNRIRVEDRKDLVEINKREAELAILRYKSADSTLSEAEQLKYLTLYQQKENELIDYKIKDKEEELAAVRKLLETRSGDITLLDREAQLLADIESFKGDRSLRVETKLSGLREKQIKAEEKLTEIQKKNAELAMTGAFMYDTEKQKIIDTKQVQIELNKIKLEGLQQNQKIADEQKRQIKAVTDYEIEQARIAKEEKRAITDESFAVISSSLTSLSNLYQQQKENELSAAGDNAQERAEIERKYSQKQQTLAIGQAIINAAMAITEIWRKYATMPVYAGILTAINAAQMTAQIAIIKQQKFAKGGSGVLEGPTHANGGINVGIGEAEGGEHIAITSRSMTAKYGPKMLDAVSKSINQGKFFEVWANVNKEMTADPYTKKMYELMIKTPSVYSDSEGNTVKEYPDGRKYVIKKFWRN